MSNNVRTLAFRFSALAAIFVVHAQAADLAIIPGDSTRGAKIFETQHCVHCHAVNGKGGNVGIDLSLIVTRRFTPALLASAMWNHAPIMWSAMEGEGIDPPKLNPGEAADLFAFFYSARFFDPSGDAA